MASLIAPVLLEQLTPVVRSTPETARKVIGRIGVVFQYAEALGIVMHNPARAIRTAAPWPRKQVKSHAAVPQADAPGAFQRVLKSQSPGAAALAVTILTGARAGTIRAMTPEMVGDDGRTLYATGDIMKTVWTIAIL